MQIIVENPYLFLLIPLLLGLLIFSGKWLSIKNKRRKRSILLLRGAVLVCLILALCNISIRLSHNSTTTVFLLDVSDSVENNKEEVEQFVKKSLKEMPSKNKVGIVAFGSDTRVEQFVTDKNLFQGIETTPITTATNLEKAIQAAMALYTEDSRKNLVLVTDGNENEGSIEKMSSTLIGSDVEVQVLKLENNITKEVYVENVTIPDKVNLGDTFRVEVDLTSNVKTSAVLSLYAGNTLKSQENIELQTGENHFVFKDTQTEQGLKSYRVMVEPVEDTLAVNNEYVAFTQAEAGKKVLLVEGQAGASKEFQKILKAGNIVYTVALPASVPRTMMEFNEYKAILTLDVHKDDLPSSFLDNVESYVKDYAGGFIAIGGENSFALGNYKETALEKILPVYMDLQGEKQIPKMALTMVIDQSGSMSANNGTITQLDLAKEAAVEALNTLRAIDFIGVVSFDDSFRWVVPMQNVTNKEDIEDKIYGIRVAGGTSIYPAIHTAYEKIIKCDAKLKHIILLSDGQDGFHEYEDLIEKINRDSVTLSTVAVGEGADSGLMEQLAKDGNGRFYYTDIDTDIPRIFAKEVYLSASAYLNNREFTPLITSNSEIIRDVVSEGLPTMLGYVAATQKELATVHLTSDKGDPILTTWQYGLGRTAAFNSDGVNKWTANYAGWSKFTLLWKNLINWVITDTTGGANNVVVSQTGNQTTLAYQAKEYTADTKVTALYTNEKGVSKEINLEAKAPGTFEAQLPLQETGVYSVNVRQEEQGKTVVNQNTALAVQYSGEYRVQQDKQILEEFVAQVNGKMIDKDNSVFSNQTKSVNTMKSLTSFFLLLAVLLWMLDIAYRRLQFDLFVYVSSAIEKLGIGNKRKERSPIRKVKNAKKEKIGTKNIEEKEMEQKTKKNKAEQKAQETKQMQGKQSESKKKSKEEMLDTSALLKKKKERQ